MFYCGLWQLKWEKSFSRFLQNCGTLGCNWGDLGMYLYKQTENIPVIHFFSLSFPSLVTWLSFYLKPNRNLASKAINLVQLALLTGETIQTDRLQHILERISLPQQLDLGGSNLIRPISTARKWQLLTILFFDSDVEKPHCHGDGIGLMVYEVLSNACTLLISKAKWLQLAKNKM